MSKQTETTMIEAIIAHFRDEAIPVNKLEAVHVSILGDLGKYGPGCPAHYRQAVSDLHARALAGSLPVHNGAPDGPFAGTHRP